MVRDSKSTIRVRKLSGSVKVFSPSREDNSDEEQFCAISRGGKTGNGPFSVVLHGLSAIISTCASKVLG